LWLSKHKFAASGRMTAAIIETYINFRIYVYVHKRGGLSVYDMSLSSSILVYMVIHVFTQTAVRDCAQNHRVCKLYPAFGILNN
jgi:hypothetical protein